MKQFKNLEFNVHLDLTPILDGDFRSENMLTNNFAPRYGGQNQYPIRQIERHCT